MSIEIYLEAVEYATKLHSGQKRKFTDEDFIVHPLRVARLIEIVHPGEITPGVVSILHDTIEDCHSHLLSKACIYDQIKQMFGYDVAQMVFELTNQFTKEACPNTKRAERKQLELERIKCIRPECKTIKCADRIDNLVDFNRVGGIPEYYRKESVDMFYGALRGKTASKYLESMLEAILS